MSAIPELHPITAALDQLAKPAPGSATEWLLSVTPILERQREERIKELEDALRRIRSFADGDDYIRMGEITTICDEALV